MTHDFKAALTDICLPSERFVEGKRHAQVTMKPESLKAIRAALRIANRLQSGEVKSETAKHLSNVWVCLAERGGIEHDIIEVVGDAVNELTELDKVFSARWDADQRAIKLWQETTGRKDTWPDHADLVLYLMMRLDMAEQAMAAQMIKGCEDGK